MKSIHENGRSMIEMLGVLSVIGVLTMASIGGYQKAVSKIGLNKMVTTTTAVLREYADLRMKGLASVNFAGPNNYIYAQECEKSQSIIDATEDVCALPLGEMYMKNEVKGTYLSFMLHITFSDSDPSLCAQFLSQNWIDLIPTRIKKGFQIYIRSNIKRQTQVVYAEGVKTKPSMSSIANICNNVCLEESSCTITFDIAVPKNAS